MSTLLALVPPHTSLALDFVPLSHVPTVTVSVMLLDGGAVVVGEVVVVGGLVVDVVDGDVVVVVDVVEPPTRPVPPRKPRLRAFSLMLSLSPVQSRVPLFCRALFTVAGDTLPNLAM